MRKDNMDCSKVKEYLYLFIDGELDGKTAKLIEEHLVECPLCKMVVGEEKRIDCFIKEHIPKEMAAYELKEKVLNKIKGREKMYRFIPHFSLLRAVPAVFIIVICLYFIFMNINKPFPIFSEAVKEHLQFLQGNLSIDIASNKPLEVYKWLQAKLDFKVIVPDLSSQGVTLLGARVCSLKNKKVAYIMYEKNEHSISVFMFEAKELKFPKAKRVSVNNKMFYLSKEKGYNSALWIDEGIACVFVSDLGEAELLYLTSL